MDKNIKTKILDILSNPKKISYVIAIISKNENISNEEIRSTIENLIQTGILGLDIDMKLYKK